MTEQTQGYDPAVEGFDEDYGDTVGDMDLRVIYDGFAFDFKCRCTIDAIPYIIAEMKGQGMKPAKSGLLWEEDYPEKYRPVSTPPQAAAPVSVQPQQPQPQPQAQPQATGWDAQGNPTYAEMPPPVQNAPPPAPRQFDPQDSAPYCPYHNAKMTVSNYGGWYCTKKTEDTPPNLYNILNAKGYCAYKYKDGKPSVSGAVGG